MRGSPIAVTVTAASLAVGAVTPLRAQSPPAAADAIEQFVQHVMREIPGLPGMAVVVVRGGEVAYLGAAGTVDVETQVPVTPATPFYIASSTKSFTAMAAAVLAERGVLDLDAPVTRYVPEMRFPEGVDAQQVTLRAMLSHTIPFRNAPIVGRTAYTGEHSPSLLIGLVSQSTLRDPGFRYDNLGYVLASLVMERVTGKPWQVTLDEVLFEPLGMTRTSAYMSEAASWGVAAPHRLVPTGQAARIRQLKVDATMHAAGGMVTSAADLARWLEAQLHAGRVDGRQVIPAGVVREAHRPQATMTPVRFGPYSRHAYGLGWYHSTIGGDTVLQHFGGYAGARAHVSFMPAHDIGVAVLLNVNGPNASAADVVASFAYDVMLGRPGAWARHDSLVAQGRADIERMSAGASGHAAEIAARPRTLSLPNAAYAGVYENPQLGRMTVREDGAVLHVSLGQLRSRSQYFTRPEAIRVEMEEGSGDVIQFTVAGGRATALRYNGLDFRRVP